MNLGIIVDSTCDLPTSIFERHNVRVIPKILRLKSGNFNDHRQPEQSNTFYREYNREMSSAKPVGLASEAVVHEIRDNLIYHYDHLIIIAPHLKLSDSLSVFRRTIGELQPEIGSLRHKAQLHSAFKIRVIESQAAFAGYGLALYEALRLLSEKARSADQLKQPLDTFKSTIETYVLPGQENVGMNHLAQPLFNLGWLAQKKLSMTQSLPAFLLTDQGFNQQRQFKRENAVNDFLGMIYDKITRTNLHNHLVNISYAGNLAQLRVLPSFKALHEHIDSKGGKLVHSVMSPCNGAQLGMKAISVAFSGKN